ncbi:hypothetical protein BaRGS_00008260 [Batillaria attramentaria]|uniref:Uncharacterized protein n=1 Tax=Batillaria attramentaria TaxID=370345 RepID=A0ABD0LMC9_9CAEN
MSGAGPTSFLQGGKPQPIPKNPAVRRPNPALTFYRESARSHRKPPVHFRYTITADDAKPDQDGIHIRLSQTAISFNKPTDTKKLAGQRELGKYSRREG